ncbi:MAG: hypothetical protein HC824_08800 [Synechococcales cyanobacterium RM1_1_8]|nr:hypothetical protein [Synechococcales cyanobacterium RM1_1_8]
MAGKTGTSEEARDLWFVGYIPQMAAGVWLGNDDNYPTSGSSGTAASLWHRVMQEITADMKVEEFPSLPDLNSRKGSIKAEPIQPGSLIEGRPEPPKQEYSGSGQDSGGYYEPEPEPYYEPEPEPYYEPAPEPYYEPAPEASYAPAPEPYNEPAPEPYNEPAPEPYYEPEPYYDPAPAPVAPPPPPPPLPQ